MAVSEKLGKQADIKKALLKSLKANASFYKNEREVWNTIDTEGWPE